MAAIAEEGLEPRHADYDLASPRSVELSQIA
jgi:hypothetical protein